MENTQNTTNRMQNRNRERGHKKNENEMDREDTEHNKHTQE